MHPGDESGPPVEVRVIDRRRFTETGDARDGADVEHDAANAAAAPPASMPDALTAQRAEPEQPAEPQPPAQPQPAARPGQAVPVASPDQPAREVLDLGVEAVFFIFYQSALIALGAPEVSDGIDASRAPDLAEARQAIDFLRVLEAKTAGNLSPEETATLRQLLDDAQTRFIHAARAMAGGRQ